MAGMRLSSVLARIQAPQDKTAAASPSPASPAPAATPSDLKDRLKAAVEEALVPVSQKTASTASPVEDLTKIAVDLSAAEHEALSKEAMLYGAALCDGFMARAAQYEAGAQKIASTPPASQAPRADDDFEKFAVANPEVVRDAAQVGYDQAMSQLTKLGQAAYDKGWNDTMHQVHKAASQCFVTGFKAVNDIIEAAR